MSSFQEMILQGIPKQMPEMPAFVAEVSRALDRPLTLTVDEQVLAIQNALRYFPPEWHETLAVEFAAELRERGRIYMYRFRPTYSMEARPIHEYPAKCQSAAAIMLMIQNNLDPKVALFPYELIVYGGNGAAFQNWAQYLLTMKYLAEMTDEQTLVLYSGHPMGLFPSDRSAPRVVVTNGMMVPNYSSKDQLNRLTALGVTSYGQMTAGSFMYIGPQGIVHGTTLTILNAARLLLNVENMRGKLFVSSGLGGMSGAQAKAAEITGAVGVIAEVDPAAIAKRKAQGWVKESFSDLDALLERIEVAQANGEGVSLAYEGNVVKLLEYFVERRVHVDLCSDQTSLHNVEGCGYYPKGLTMAEAKRMMNEDPVAFYAAVKESLKLHVICLNLLAERGTKFFDYGNAFLLEAGKAGAKIFAEGGTYRYPSYVENIMGPMCFDYGFGPFRWVCTSGKPEDLQMTDQIAADILRDMIEEAPPEIRGQLQDNLEWILEAEENKLVVGSQARILYSNEEGRRRIAHAFNEAVSFDMVSAPIVIGRDHHDVSGTDSPYRETSNIRDGSKLCADMAVQNVIGCSFRGATWVSIHNGGGVGWGEVINGGFGMVLDGSNQVDRAIDEMIAWDVNNGIARRSWAGNPGAQFTAKAAMKNAEDLQITMPVASDRAMVVRALKG